VINWLAAGNLGRWVDYRFTDRSGGVSKPPFDSLNIARWVGDEPAAVAGNMATISNAIELKLLPMHPVHGVAVQEVFGDETSLRPADILITLQSNVALLIPSADCVSVLGATKQKRFLLAAHVGWRGAAAGIAAKILSTAELYGVTAADLELVLGPAICGNCYEVSDDVQSQVAAQLPTAPVNRGKLGLDLRVGLANYFADRGATVFNNLPCTYESKNLYSYRRDSKTGRQAMVAWVN
jgi:YfiH family protein